MHQFLYIHCGSSTVRHSDCLQIVSCLLHRESNTICISTVLPRCVCITDRNLLSVTFRIFNFQFDFSKKNLLQKPSIHHRLPFNWQTPVTYVLGAAYQLLFFLSVLEIFVSFLLIYFGICHFLVAFVADIDQNFADFRQDVIACRRRFTAERQIHLYQSLKKIIEFHSNAIQLRRLFNSF